MDNFVKTKFFMLVDYESILLESSYKNVPEVDKAIYSLFNDGYNHQIIQDGVIFGDWSWIKPPINLPNNLRCVTVPTGDLASNVDKIIETDNFSDIYILVSGKVNNLILDRFINLKKRVVLWTITDPKAEQLRMCLGWKKITWISQNISAWPRRVNLYAIVLLFTSLSNYENNFSIDLQEFVQSIKKLPKLKLYAAQWVYIAVLENILKIKSDQESKFPKVSLNSSHELAKEANIIATRILSASHSLLPDSTRVSFGMIEKTIRTMKVFQKNERYRQSWIELMIDIGFLSANQQNAYKSKHPTTYITPGPRFPGKASLDRIKQFQVMRLVILIDDFIRRKRYKWISTSNALRILTRSSTLAEARRSLDYSKSREIIKIEKIPNINLNGFPVSAISLNYSDEFVLDSLSKRDKVIYLLDALVTDRPYGVTLSVLTKSLIDSKSLNEEEAIFWVNTLIEESILRRVTFVKEYPVGLYHLRLDDSIVSTAISH